jgi:hypothetical protein
VAELPLISGSAFVSDNTVSMAICTTGGEIIGIWGDTFQRMKRSNSAVQSTSCTTTTWESSTSMLCKIAGGVGSTLAFTTSNARRVLHSKSQELHYASPKSLDKQPTTTSDFITTAAITLKLIGKNYGMFGCSPQTTSCKSNEAAPIWKSDSCVVFKTARGIRTSFSSIAVTVMMMFAQISMEFTFLYPIISALELPFYVPSPSTGSTANISLLSLFITNTDGVRSMFIMIQFHFTLAFAGLFQRITKFEGFVFLSHTSGNGTSFIMVWVCMQVSIKLTYTKALSKYVCFHVFMYNKN